MTTLQIITLVAESHRSVGGESLPSPYFDFLSFMSWVAFDFVSFLPLGCVSSQYDHFDSVLTVTCGPILIFAFLWAAFLAGKVKKSHLKTFLDFMLLVLPAISRRICQSFRVVEYDDGQYSYLGADHSIEGGSSRYWGVFSYALLSCLIFPVGLPLGLYFALRRYKTLLRPPGLPDAQAFVERERHAEEFMSEAPITSISIAFRPSYW